MSFRYYDPILRIIQMYCSETRQDFFSLKNEFNINQIWQKNSKAKFEKFMGFDKDKQKLAFKYGIVNELEKKGVEPSDS
jgi:hypothetical protein